MATFDSIVTRMKVFLNDEGAATWDTEMLATFLNDGIRDYSQYFPRLITTTINVSDDDNEYDLPADFMTVHSVEYPTGQDPPIYLIYKKFTGPLWWQEEYNYDIINHYDDTDPPELWISADSPATGETIAIIYNGHHQLITNTAAISGTNTIPPWHQQLLTKYVYWQAALHLASSEQQSPTSNSSLLMAQLAQNARRLALDYSTNLQQALFAAEGKSEPTNWTENNNTGVERIY